MAMGWNETGGSLPFGPKPMAPAINWKNPLTVGLVMAIDYAAPSLPASRDLVNPTAVGAYTGTAPGFGPFGPQRTFLANTDKDAITLPSSVSLGNQLSGEFIFKNNVGGFGSILSIGGIAADGDTFVDINHDDITNAIGLGFGRNTTSGGWHDTAANFPSNQFTHVVWTYDGSSTANAPTLYKNGVLQPLTQGTAPVGTRVTPNNSVLVGNFPGQNFGILADMSYQRLWNNRILNANDAADLFQNPWQIYNWPLPIIRSSLPATVYNVSVAETASAAETVSDTAVLPSALAETGTAADTVSNVTTHPATITEAASAADTISNGSTYASTLAETASAADTINATTQISETLAETASAADTVSNVGTFPRTVAESATAAETVSDTAVLPSTLADTASAADTVNGATIISVSVAETASASDTISGKATIAETLVELANAQDHEDAALPSDTTLMETMVATDSYSATIIAGASLVETASAADAYGASLIIPAALAETMTAADVIQARADLSALLLEIADAQDVTNSILNASLSIVETANAADIWDSSRATPIPSKCDSLKGPFIVRSLSGPVDCGDCG